MPRGNPLGLGLVLVGAAMMLVSVFLPLNQPAGPFGRVQDNSLIQHGGWILVALAVAIAAAGYQASRAGQQAGYWIASLVLCVVAGGLVFFLGTNKGARTLYPVDANGNLDTSHPTVGSLGIAIYVAGVGIALAAVGSLMQRQSQTVVATTEAASAVETSATAATTVQPRPSFALTTLAQVLLAGLAIIVGVGVTIYAIGARTDALVGAGAAAVLFLAMAATVVIARI